MAGYFQIDRSLAQALLPRHGDKFTESEAYTFLASFVAFAPREELVKGKLISLNVGELVASERYLESRWSWSRTKVRSFKMILEKRGLLDQRKDQGETVLILSNTRDSSAVETTKKTTKKTRREPEENQQRTNIRKRKKEKEKTLFAETQAIAWSATDGWSGISNDDLSQWKEAYPACDINRHLADMNLWLKNNPARSKKKQWGRFITNWLRRQQERGGDMRGKSEQSSQSSENPDIGGRTMCTTKVSAINSNENPTQELDDIPI